MEKISAREFFTAMWRGVCTALGLFFGLFGFRRDGRFARILWGLFAVSCTIIVMFIAAGAIYGCWKWVDRTFLYSHHCDEYCYYSVSVYDDIWFHNTQDGKGYIYDAGKRKKTLEDVEWIAEPEFGDSLVCYSDGKKRGYFNKYTGEVVIAPNYDHAWIFSEGLAGVDVGGSIKFIDAKGDVVIDTHTPYRKGMADQIFKAGYCKVYTADGKLCGLMDKKGHTVLPRDYDNVSYLEDEGLWQIDKDGSHGILDGKLHTVIPLTECSIYVENGTIDLVLADHTISKYSYEGNLIDDFCISDVRVLEYEKEEIVYKCNTEDGDATVEEYHPKATARLRAYVAGEGYEGLMTTDGRRVTMPLYWKIEAIGPDLYLCTMIDGDGVIVNGKGEVVKLGDRS